MPRHRSIAWWLAAMFAGIAALVFSGVAVLLYCVMIESVRGQLQGELDFHHSLMAPKLEAVQSAAGWDQAKRTMDRVSQEAGRLRYWTLSSSEQFRYGRPPDGQVSTAISGITYINNEPESKIWVYMTWPIPAAGERPDMQLAIALDCTAYMHLKQQFKSIIIITAILGCALVALLGFWITRLGLRPVRNMSRQAVALPPQDPRQRLVVENAPAEIRDLAQSFNHALARREQAWRQLEAFNADVAHELRTPLTNLMGQTQVALAHMDSVGELKELLASNLEELERMASIVNDMLFLSRVDNGHRAVELDALSLHGEALKTAEYLEPTLAERGLKVSVQGDVVAHVNKRLFHRALANLLANSGHYAHEGSSVAVTIERRGSHARISVADNGDPIPETEQARLFERFYRSDTARAGARHGLGLSIVQGVARMHGGEVFVSSRDGVNIFGFSMRLMPL